MRFVVRSWSFVVERPFYELRTMNEEQSYGLQPRPYAERSMVERVRTKQEVKWLVTPIPFAGSAGERA